MSPKPKRTTDEDDDSLQPQEFVDEEQGVEHDLTTYQDDNDMQSTISATTTNSISGASIRMLTDEELLTRSLYAVRFAVFSDAVSSTILDPNFAFMALPGSHPDSFESTGPFGVTAATYFLAMTAPLGAALASTIIGSISDRIGRKPCLLACLGVGAVGAILNYLVRESFWGFCAANFAQGLFAASTPVAMAYVSDVKRTRKEKDAEIGILMALFMLGISGGGVCTILMESSGLFTPLFLGAALNTIATILLAYYAVESKKMPSLGKSHTDEDDDEQEILPEKIDNKVMWNVVIGALLDNVGSAGLLPMAMAPLALNEFYINFVTTGQEPLMTQSAFKWLSVMVALTIVPGAGASQWLFDKVGAAASCVAGNVMTAILTIAVLFIASVEPATNATYASFIAALYIGFPFTVLSQLSTGPMLDSLAPADKRGYVQGLNVSVMNFASACSPYILGEMSDALGVRQAMWTCIAISFVAALVNVPLIYTKVLQRPKKVPRYARSLKYEDPQFVARVREGQWVSAKELERLNDKRLKEGDPFLVIPYKPYEEDRENLHEIKRNANSDFRWLRRYLTRMLNDYDSQSEESREALLEQWKSARPDEEQRAELAAGLSKWFVEYLEASGYWPDDSPLVYKQMIMQAFPPLLPDGEEDLTANNLKVAGFNYLRVLNKYLDERKLSGATKAFAANGFANV